MMLNYILTASKSRRGFLSAVLWVIGVFSLYMTYSVSYSALQAQQRQRSPVSAHESPRQDKCLASTAENWLYPESPSAGVLIISSGNSHSVDLLMNSIYREHKVVYVSPKEVPKTFDNLVGDVWGFTGNANVTILAGSGNCNTKAIKDSLSRHNISKYHIVFDPLDFYPLSQDAATVVLECLINSLEAFASSKDLQGYVHVEQPRSILASLFPVKLGLFSTSLLDSAGKRLLGDASWLGSLLSLSCSITYDFKEPSDVLLNSVELYSMTYKRLYDLDLSMVVV